MKKKIKTTTRTNQEKRNKLRAKMETDARQYVILLLEDKMDCDARSAGNVLEKIKHLTPIKGMDIAMPSLELPYYRGSNLQGRCDST